MFRDEVLIDGGKLPLLRRIARPTGAHKQFFGGGVTLETVGGNGVEQGAFGDVEDPLLVSLHSVTGIEDDGGFERGGGDVEADGALLRP